MTKPKGVTLPLYKFVVISDTEGRVTVTPGGLTTDKTSWSLVPGGIVPFNLAPITAVAPTNVVFKGQNAAAGYASVGGDVNLQSGTGSVGNVSGNVVVSDTAGNSGWNTGHLRLGAYHLWIDASGRLRVKATAPISDTDGTVVGTQI